MQNVTAQPLVYFRSYGKNDSITTCIANEIYKNSKNADLCVGKTTGLFDNGLKKVANIILGNEIHRRNWVGLIYMSFLQRIKIFVLCLYNWIF